MGDPMADGDGYKLGLKHGYADGFADAIKKAIWIVQDVGEIEGHERDLLERKLKELEPS